MFQISFTDLTLSNLNIRSLLFLSTSRFQQKASPFSRNLDVDFIGYKILISVFYLIPSKPSSDPFTVRTGTRAYAFATRRFLSNTITFAQISSSIWRHLSRTSWRWSCKHKGIFKYFKQKNSNYLMLNKYLRKLFGLLFFSHFRQFCI